MLLTTGLTFLSCQSCLTCQRLRLPPAHPNLVGWQLRHLGAARLELPEFWPHPRVAQEPDDGRRLLGREQDRQIVAVLSQRVAGQQELGVLKLRLVRAEPGDKLL